jgi:hypothetical protein
MINFHAMSEPSFVVDLNLGKGDVFLRETRCLLPSHSFAALVMDLKELVNLLKRKSGSLDVEVIDDGNPDEVQYSEYDVEFPADIGNSCVKLSAGVLRQYSIMIMNSESGVDSYLFEGYSTYQSV